MFCYGGYSDQYEFTITQVNAKISIIVTNGHVITSLNLKQFELLPPLPNMPELHSANFGDAKPTPLLSTSAGVFSLQRVVDSGSLYRIHINPAINGCI